LSSSPSSAGLAFVLTGGIFGKRHSENRTLVAGASAIALVSSIFLGRDVYGFLEDLGWLPGSQHPAAAAPLLSGEAYLSRAQDEMEAGDLAGAESDLNAAIARDPMLAGAFHVRAKLQLTKGRWHQAQADLQSAAQLRPDDAAIRADLVNFQDLRSDAMLSGLWVEMKGQF
jgi:tetratricopeptide (TPR) repeat protein